MNSLLSQKVASILAQLKFQPDIFPTGRNSIQLEYEIGDDYLEFEIFEDKIVALIQYGGKNEETEVTIEDIVRLTDDFHRSKI